MKRGDKVALMLLNRPEFHIADLAVMTLGATPFSIYATYTREQIEYLVEDSGAKVALIEAAFAERFPELEHVLVLEEGWPTDPGFDAEPHWRAIEPEDEITLIYTSGTTGPPKGVQLVHRNLMTAVQSVESLIRFPDGSKVISWLPSRAHRRADGAPLPADRLRDDDHTCPNPREVVGYLPAVKPTWFFAVPRIWEKLKAGMEGFLLQGEDAEETRVARRRVRKVELSRVGRRFPLTWRRWSPRRIESCSPALRAMLGLDEAGSVNVGAAPTPREVLVFFHAIGIPLAELWGMSETCGAGCCNPPDRIKIGTVGPAGAGRRAEAGGGRRAAHALRRRDDRLPQRARQDGRGARRRRLAAHRRHRRDRRRRLRPDRRPQEGDHHQRGRQEHVAGQHRVDVEGRQPADRPGVRDRRRRGPTTPR